MRHIAFVILLIGCAAPVDEIQSALGGYVDPPHDSTWYRIRYFPTGHPEAPAPNCSPVVDTPGCYTSIAGANDPDVPDYIEDLGVFLDAAHNILQIHYDLPTSGRMDVEVKNISPYPGAVHESGLITIDESVEFADAWSFAYRLRDTAWHEVFHVAQNRAFEGAPPWENHGLSGRHRWLLESTATEVAFEANPIHGPHPSAEGTLLLNFPLAVEHWEEPERRLYAPFMFFHYLKARGIDFARRWFGEGSTVFTPSTVPETQPIAKFFFDELRGAMQSAAERRDLFLDFALAYQLTRDNAVIPDVRRMLVRHPPFTYELTGYERKDPGAEDEHPRPIPNTVGDGKEHTLLRPGTMATHAIGLSKVLCTETGPSCNPEAVPVPELAKLVVNIALRAVGPGDSVPHYGAVWRVRSSTAPVRLATFVGSETERELVFDLADLARNDKLVVTVVHDPEVAPSETEGLLQVTAAFDDACRSKTIVVDHPDSQVGYYGGAGKLFITEKGCTKMLVKMWGGGGALGHWLFSGFTHGNGGGGAFVGARIPVDPVGENLRATVPFSSLTGTPGGFPSFIYQPATQSTVANVIAIAGAGGRAGVGSWTTIMPPDGGAAHQNAPLALWTNGSSSIALSGGTAGTEQAGGFGGTVNSPFGDGRAFTTAMITGYTWEAGGYGSCEAGTGGSGWFGGGGGGRNCAAHLGSGGGGGASFVVPTRLNKPVTMVKIGGDRRTPGRVDDPDRMTPPPPGTSCQGGASAIGDPGRGRLGTGPAWCDNPGRIVIKFGKAAANDTSVAP